MKTWASGIQWKIFLGCRLKNAVTKFKSLMHLEVRCHNKTILQPLKVSYYEDTWIFLKRSKYGISSWMLCLREYHAARNMEKTKDDWILSYLARAFNKKFQNLWDVGVLQVVELEGKSCSKKSWRILRLAIVRL